MKSNTQKEYTLTDHFSELRKRLVYVIVFFIIAFLSLWSFRNDLLNIYMVPIYELIKSVSGEIILLKIVDKFFIHLKTCLFFSIIISLPIAGFHLWKFLKPGLYKKEQKVVMALCLFLVIFFYLGMITAYFLIIPLGFEFLVNYSVNNDSVFTSLNSLSSLSISLSEHIGFTQKFLYIFGFIFETPLVVLLLTKLNIVTVKQLSKYRKHVIVGCFALAALLTPPDPLTMVCLGLPLIVLFELGLIVSRIFSKTPQALLAD